MVRDAPVIRRKLRCAVYTRKSSEEGLEQEFNSLDAQREACENYVASQKPEGWVLVSDRYDDGGVSGGTLERPALKRLLADIEAGAIDIVVTYKIDRLSRSLMDFTKLVEVFERKSVTFVSITQAFNTTSSMGRLMLNVLLSFAQFEREVIGERIRDKVAASRRKGMWMGGIAPLGYDVKDRKLVINAKQAKLVRSIFVRFARGKSGTKLVQVLAEEGSATRSGRPFSKTDLYKLLHNKVYLGLAVHKGTAYPGEHEAIIDQSLWDNVHAVFKSCPHKRRGASRADTPAMLKGLIFGSAGQAMTPSHTRKNGRLYRYYVSVKALKFGAEACPVKRIAAAEIESVVVGQIRTLIQTPQIIVATWRKARATVPRLTEQEVRAAFERFDSLWNQLFHAEQARIVQLLVERIDIQPDAAEITLRTGGLIGLVSELGLASKPAQEAA